MKFLVTGGLGYIGSCMTAFLVNQGHKVCIIDSEISSSIGFNKILEVGAEFYRSDISSPDVERYLLENKFDAVFHFAGLIDVEESTREIEKYYTENFFKTVKFANMCKKSGINKFIFSSTAAVYGNNNSSLEESLPCRPSNPYGNSKFFAEIALKEMSCDTFKIVCFRYFNVAGAFPEVNLGENRNNETHLIPCAMSCGEIDEVLDVFGNDYNTNDGSCIRDYIHVRDLTSAHLLGISDKIKNNFEIFNLGSGDGTSVFSIINEIKKIYPNFKFRISERRIGDPAKLVANCNKAKTYLGWEPKFSNINNIIKDTHNFRAKAGVF